MLNLPRPYRALRALHALGTRAPAFTRACLAVSACSFFFIAACALMSSASALAQSSAEPAAGSMAESIRAGWSTYIFVSTGTPRASLVDLAHEASRARAVLVFRGFAQDPDAPPGAPVNLQGLQTFVAGIDAQCCRGARVSWVVDPRLFDRYTVRAAPTFVVAWGDAARPQDYSLIAGDMALANALKSMAQHSALPGIRKRAAAVYTQAFGGQS